MNRPFDAKRYKRLLEGLEVTVLRLSEVRNENHKLRYDAEYFSKAAQTAYALLRGQRRFGAMVKSGYRVVYENTEIIERNEGAKEGLPFFLQAANIDTPFINAEGMGCVQASDWSRYVKGRIKPGELLIEVKGQAEKVALVPAGFPENTLVTGTCYKATLKDSLDAPLAIAFFTCKHGQALKNRLKSNLLVSFVSKEDLFSIPVPDFSVDLKRRLSEVIEGCFKYQRESKVALEAAESTLTAALGLDGWQPPQPLSYTRRASQAFAAGRLDAEYFREAYVAAQKALKQAGAIKFVPLEQLLSSLTNGHTPLRHDLTVGEVPFLCAEHVADFELSYDSDKRILGRHHQTELARTRVREGDVLLSIKGRVGNFALAEEVPGDVNINQDVALLRFKDTLPIWWVLAFLNSPFGKLQVQQHCTGGINPFLGLGNVRKLLVAVFEDGLMAGVGEQTRKQVHAARAARRHARELLAAAQHAVEVAIEQNEAAALAYLAGQGVEG